MRLEKAERQAESDRETATKIREEADTLQRMNKNSAEQAVSGYKRDQIIIQSEDAKKRLSTEDFAPILLMRYGGRKIAHESVSLEEFQGLIAQKVEDAADVLRQAARRARAFKILVKREKIC